jgi:transposase
VFIGNGDVEPDNNLVENPIRPTAIGKKNWLFFGSETSGQQSAVIYTVVENCKRLGIDPYEYLLDVFKRLPLMTNRNVEQLLPENWLAERQKKRLKLIGSINGRLQHIYIIRPLKKIQMWCQLNTRIKN